jgi:formylglycine-generating enzyme required for sulfatase activity
MLPGHRVALLLFALLVLPSRLLASEAIAIEISILENTLDGCTECACRQHALLEPGQNQHFWMAYATVKPGAESTFKRDGPAALAYCGMGSFSEIRHAFMQARGVPYLIVELEMHAVPGATAAPDVHASWSVSKLSKFKRRKAPKYQELKHPPMNLGNAAFEFATPLSLSDESASKEFKSYELMMVVVGNTLPADIQAFGSFSIEGDVPGAYLFLEGGIVGRIPQGRPLHLQAIPVGTHELEVRELSGRARHQSVQLHAGETVSLKLNLLDETVAGTHAGLLDLGKNPQGFQEYFRLLDLATMVHIPAGNFQMGSDLAGRDANEQPLHSVNLPDFLIDKTEVTWRQFGVFSDATGVPLPPEPEWGRLEHYPLSFTTWDEARQYCQWAGGRLPTEAEWEKAGRGTDGRPYPWGDDWDPTRCNSISGGMHRPEAVGSFPECSSPYGVLDMTGSHWQWTQDYYSETAHSTSGAGNPGGTVAGMARVKRGSYWMAHPEQLHLTVRGKSDAEWRNFSHGFRCAKDLEAPPE